MTKKTRIGLLRFINESASTEPAVPWMDEGQSWLEENLDAIFGGPKYPVTWLQRIDGVWRIFRRESPDAEIEEIPWIEDPESCTIEDLEERE